MKAGPFLGCVGCLTWLLNFATATKPDLLTLSLSASALGLLVTATIVTGFQKRRTGLGIALSPLAVVFGVGFLVMLLVPEKGTERDTG